MVEDEVVEALSRQLPRGSTKPTWLRRDVPVLLLLFLLEPFVEATDVGRELTLGTEDRRDMILIT